MITEFIKRKSDFFTKAAKKIIIFAAAMMIIGSVTIGYSGNVMIAQAHSCRTDSQRGHHGYKNRSGSASYYHYGYAAHLHPDGVCPYYNSNAVSSSKQTPVSAPEKKAELKAEDYKLVFDSSYYYNNNPDLQTTVGKDEQKLLEHFVSCGMAEQRRGCSDFDVIIYKDSNTDLWEEYGDNLTKYYEHFKDCGHKENRIHNNTYYNQCR